MSSSPIRLTCDEVDDLIYSSRTGDISSLQDLIQTLSHSYSCTTSTIIKAAIDVDEEGLGSGSCLLHYPAANGNLEVVQHLLTHLAAEVAGSVSRDSATDGDGNDSSTAYVRDTKKFINHTNVSGNTALHWAGMNGHLEIVKALMQAGADPEIVNGAGKDAVVESEWSSKPGAADCAVWMLRECGELEKGVTGTNHESNADEEELANMDQEHDTDFSQSGEASRSGLPSSGEANSTQKID